MHTRFAIVAGIVLLGITALAILVPIPHPSSVSVVGKTAEVKTAPTPTKTVLADEKAPEFYGDSVRAGLFARPLPPEPPAPAESTQPQVFPDPPVIPPPDLFADYVYTGTVTLDGQKHALLENSRTREGSYLLQGDTLQGATVMQIDDNNVTLNVHGKMRRIPKSTVYNVVPLNAQAGSTSDKNTQNRGNPDTPQVMALRQKEQQAASEALTRTLSEASLQPTGSFQATFSTTGEGGNTIIFSLDDPNNP